MAKQSPPWNIPLVSEWVTTVLLPALYLNEALCSISSLKTYKIRQFYCSLLPVLLIFLPSYVESCQMFSGNQSRLYLNSCSSSCSPHILLLIPFALLVISSALPDVWRFFWLLFLFVSCTWLLSMQWVGSCRLPSYLLILVANKLFLWLASR